MKKIIILLLIGTAFSCKNTQSVTLKDNSDPSKYIDFISEKDLKTMLYVVASDEMEGRETGSKGQKKAGLYMIGQYKKHGISFPKGATDYYQHIPASFLNARRNENLPDSENIWAYIEGSEKPDEVLVISAHYDHVGVKNGDVYNGADDDGSGTVAVMEMAKAFAKAKKDGHGPKRSILFLHVTGEEHGLHGSRYYSENPLFPIANTIADINIDMIGRRDVEHEKTNNYVYVIGADRLSTDLHNIVVAQNEKYTKIDLDFKFNDPKDPNHFYERSDHYNFAKFGIPSVFFFNGVHEDYHRKGDEPQKIEYDALTKRTKLAFSIAWELANRSDRPVVDKPIK
ncbi:MULTISPECIES: M28 family peptidase [Flavobacterium]|uniref:Peptidase M28 n=2 Tax=Flavobacterium TaxID=237 RepID=A0A1S1J2I6_9FLAO|nr:MULTISPECIES: M28 family peptidase [Flavobacterium]MCC9016285.1 M28 family peptidase [Flavobacterium sp. F-126]OHT44842.1 peptidase M28 [Flavobacterium tructae]OXB14856.1 peptidase M28 [Flavobacterium tructae]OXB24794.1 peptidase M28 [Flavobacterium tructae]URC12409.1 M28 family peptidase [Flavobacterium sp. B183]